VESFTLVQLSDIHLTADGSLRPGVRPRDNLVAALRLVNEARIAPDAYLLTGDLTDVGDAGCYEDLAALMRSQAEADGAEVVYVPGNHDERDAFRRHLLGVAGAGPINQTHWCRGLRIISLDSTIPGVDEGALDNETLAYLAAELEARAPEGTVLVLHHPPITSPIKTMSRLRLQNPDELRDLIAGSDVRVVLCGHNHHDASGIVGGIPVWVSPALAYRADLTSTEKFRGVPGSALSRIDLSPTDHTVVTVPVPHVRDVRGPRWRD